MKIKELASELSLTGKEVLEKAKSMGIAVSDVNDDMSEIDTTAVRNTITKSGAHTETKVVRVRTKKSENDKKDGEPKVTVKAAKIKLPEVKKSAKTTAKSSNKTTAAKPPMGKPIVSKEVEGRMKPPEGKPVVSKDAFEERTSGNIADKAAEKKSEDKKVFEEKNSEISKMKPVSETASVSKQEAKKPEIKKAETKRPEPPR